MAALIRESLHRICLVPRPVEVRQPYFLEVSIAFFETMQIDMIDGRDFRSADLPPRLESSQPLPGVGIVNETFARLYLNGRNPVGEFVEVRQNNDLSTSMQIVGFVRDAAYRNLREPMPPTVYVPMQQRTHNTLLVRTAANPLSIVPTLRSQAARIHSDIKIGMVGIGSAAGVIAGFTVYRVAPVRK